MSVLEISVPIPLSEMTITNYSYLSYDVAVIQWEMSIIK